MSKLRERLAAALQRWLGKPGPQGHAQSIDEMVGILRAQADDAFVPHARINKWDVQNYFRRWQYAASTAIADAGCLAEYEVQTRREGQWAEDSGHPLAALLRRPNAWMTTRELIYYLFLDLLYVGEHYWYIAPNGVGEPAEIWPLVGEVEPLRSATEFLTGYKVTTSTQQGPRTRTFKIEEIVPFRLPMLQNVYEGFSPMRAAGGSVKVDDELLKAQWHTFRQGAFPFAVLLMSEQDPEKRKALLGRFNDLYAGAKKSGKTIGINKDTMDVKILSNKPREMDFGDSADRVRDSITGMFRVPPVLMGLTRDVQNRATAAAAEYVFAKWNIRPKLALIQDRINMDLALRYYGPDVRVKFENPVPADRQQERLDRDMLLRNHVLTINEVRELQGYGPVEWGRRPLVPTSVAPLGEPVPGQEREQSLTAEDAENAERRNRTDTAIATAGGQRAVRGFGRANRRVIATHHVELQQRFARSYRRMWTRLFAELEVEFLGKWDACREACGEGNAYVPVAAEQAVDEVLGAAGLADRMRERSRPYVARALVMGGRFDAKFADVPGSAAWGARSRAFGRYAALYDASYYRGLADRVRQRLIDLLDKGMRERVPGEPLRSAVVGAFAAMKQSLAAEIAATEAPKLLATGAQAFREEFEIEHKQWIAPDSDAEDGRVARNAETFGAADGGVMYPGATSCAGEAGHRGCAAVALPRQKD